MNTDWTHQSFLDNNMDHWLMAAGIIVGGLIFKRFVSHQLSGFIYRFIKKRSEGVQVNELRVLLRKPVGFFIVVVSLYFAAMQLHFPTEWHLTSKEEFGILFVINKLFLFALFYSITWILLRLVDFFALILQQRAIATDTMVDDQLVPFIKESLKFVVMIVSFFVMLGSVFHVNVASLIAGLGIGGLALALAAKDTLENLLGSFTIFLDKPFTLGDVVKVGNVQGKIEKIGFRSTLIRTMEKTLIKVPNKRMIDADLENISLRDMIRASFHLTLKMHTTRVQIENFMKEGTAILQKHKEVAHDPEPFIRLDKITDIGFELQVQFFINTTDADFFQLQRQDILLSLIEIAQQHDIRFDARLQDATVK
jgi:MscS family membrane protein